MGNPVQELAWRYLQKLYELSGYGLHPEVEYRTVQSEVGLSNEQARSAVAYLLDKNLVTNRCVVPCIKITTAGIDVMQQSYADKEIRVLKKIYDLSGQNTTKPVGFQELVSAVELSDSEVSGICKGLSDEQGLIEWEGGDIVFITRRGIDVIDSIGKPKPRGGDSYIVNAHTINALQQGSGNVQNIQINPQFDNAIAALREEIKSSQLPEHEIEDLQEQVTGLNRLALSEPNKAVLLDKVKARIDYIKLALSGTEVLIKVAPHLETVWHFISRH